MATFVCNNCKDQLVIVPTSSDDISGSKAEAVLLDSELTKYVEERGGFDASSQLAQYARLFELVSGDTEIDQPLCHDCTVMFARKLERITAEAKEELEAYTTHLKEMESHKPALLSDIEIEKQMALAQEEEDRLMEELRKVESARTALKEEATQLRQQKETLEVLETRYWKDFNSYQLELGQYRHERDSVQRSIEHLTEQLLTLRSTNVLNDTFYISAEGPCGTINRLRLARQGSSIDWTETNGAWGLVCLLLDMLARRYHYVFQTARLLPMGSSSKIEVRGNLFDLYNPPGGFFSTISRQFNSGMVAFLHCVLEFQQFIQSMTTDFTVPYIIEKDAVNGINIQYHGSRDDDNWTKALRYMLVNLKFILTWAAQTPPSA